MEELIKINPIMLATDLAHTSMLQDLSLSENNVWQNEDNDSLYSEEAQNSFNKWYDYFYNKIMNGGHQEGEIGDV